MAGQSGPASTRCLAGQPAAAPPDARLRHARGGHMAPVTHSLALKPLIAGFLASLAVAAASPTGLSPARG